VDLLVGKFLFGSPASRNVGVHDKAVHHQPTSQSKNAITGRLQYSMTDTLVELARNSPDCAINNPGLSFVQLAKSISQSKKVSISAAQTETLFTRSGVKNSAIGACLK